MKRKAIVLIADIKSPLTDNLCAVFQESLVLPWRFKKITPRITRASRKLIAICDLLIVPVINGLKPFYPPLPPSVRRVALVDPADAASHSVCQALKLFDGVILSGNGLPDSLDPLNCWGFIPDISLASAHQYNNPVSTENPLILAGNPQQDNLDWWAELLPLLPKIKVVTHHDQAFTPGSLVINLNHRAWNILHSGAVLLQPYTAPPLPPNFVAGRDYYYWQPGQLPSIVDSLLYDPDLRLWIGHNGRQAYLLWRKRQTDSLLVRIQQAMAIPKTLQPVPTQRRLLLEIHRDWLSPRPTDWDKAVIKWSRKLTPNSPLVLYNRAVIGVRKFIKQSFTATAPVVASLDTLFQTAEEHGLRHPALYFHWAFLLAATGNPRLEKDLLLRAIAFSEPATDFDRHLLTLPDFQFRKHAFDYLGVLWEQLAYAWEASGYHSPARISMALALRYQEHPDRRGYLALQRLKAGDMEGAINELAIACGKGCFIPEVWHQLSQLLLHRGKLEEARHIACWGNLLLQRPAANNDPHPLPDPNLCVLAKGWY